MSEIIEERRKKHFIIAVLVIALSCLTILTAPGQQSRQNSTQKNDSDAAKAMPSREIELSITPVVWSSVSGSYEATARYKEGVPVLFELVLTDRMEKPTDVDMSIGNHLFQWRPRLVKDGNRVPYRKGANEKLEKVDNEIEPFHGSRVSYRLEPGTPKRVGFLPLDDWYDLPLAPGKYELTFWYRFWGKEKPAKSNAVTFEIVPLT